MATPHDGLANVIADVSFNILDGTISTFDRFQVGPIGVTAGTDVGSSVPNTVAGIALVSSGVVDVAIDVGKGAGPTTPASSLQCEFSVAASGAIADGTLPMSWTVSEKTAAVASTPNIRIYRFQFFSFTLTPGPVGSVVSPEDPAQCTITIRRKKELLPV